VRLRVWDFGGAGPAVLPLHGLAGHAREWAATATWLAERRRVVTFDARGHGQSSRCPDDVGRDALVADAAFVLGALRLGPAVVVGQSLGGLTALSLAARRPELVRGLVPVLGRMLSEGIAAGGWAQGESIRCPAVVVRGESGALSAEAAAAMAARLPGTQGAAVPGAGHDLHLDSPARW
jgi:pimeloyl-ACP methyl ester carboxylesterase